MRVLLSHSSREQNTDRCRRHKSNNEKQRHIDAHYMVCFIDCVEVIIDTRTRAGLPRAASFRARDQDQDHRARPARGDG
jgi:hypothetical protein